MAKIETIDMTQAKFGFANTVPQFNSRVNKWGVWDKTKERFVNINWFDTADEAIEDFDYQTVQGTRVKKAPPKPAIKRERGGDKFAVAQKYVANNPTLGTADIAKLCMREMTNVTFANFYYLVNKAKKAQAA